MNYTYHIPNWHEYQHYKNRNPPWIKLHYELLSSADWVGLDDASRVLAVACMLLASRHDGKIPSDAEYIKRVCYLNKAPNFTPLVKSGFICLLADASNLLADASTCLQDASDYVSVSSYSEEEEKAKKVLEYLNEVTGKQRTRIADIQKCIRKFKPSIQDCKDVIDLKWGQWGGKPNMVDQVKPTVLFGLSHFEDYLDEAKAAQTTIKMKKTPPTEF
jgi:uncharacterized phage protein (TIGR02220 family)